MKIAVAIDLSFPGPGRYDALAVKDDPADAASVKMERTTITPNGL